MAADGNYAIHASTHAQSADSSEFESMSADLGFDMSDRNAAERDGHSRAHQHPPCSELYICGWGPAYHPNPYQQQESQRGLRDGLAFAAQGVGAPLQEDADVIAIYWRLAAAAAIAARPSRSKPFSINKLSLCVMSSPCVMWRCSRQLQAEGRQCSSPSFRRIGRGKVFGASSPTHGCSSTQALNCLGTRGCRCITRDLDALKTSHPDSSMVPHWKSTHKTLRF